MDESLQDLENELKRLSPRVPSAQLLARLEADLAAPEIAHGSHSARPKGLLLFGPWLDWRLAGATAAVVAFAVVVVTLRQTPHRDNTAPAAQTIAAATVVAPVEQPAVVEAPQVSPVPQSDRYHPVGAATVLYDLKEDSTVNSPNRAPAHRVRYRYVDTYTWKNPATNASLKWSVPRDEVRVIPASLH